MLNLRLAVDIGGTFTDGVMEDAGSNRIWVGKTLTTPDDPGRGVSAVAANLMQQASATGGDFEVGEVVHATTLVTNALIERKGVPTILVLTAGMADAPDIAREVRYDLYDLALELPRALIPADMRVEVRERIGADGAIIEPLSAQSLTDAETAVRRAGVDAVAICLLNSYVNGQHEKAIANHLARHLPHVKVSISSEVAPAIREFERASTVAANAYVQPLMDAYLGMLRDRLTQLEIDGSLRIMLSSGGFTTVEQAARQPIQLLESGPAAGVISALNTGMAAGQGKLLAFDMGGTTAKACVIVDGEPDITHMFEAARVKRFKKGSGLPILIPSIDLIEIGAGGGSVAAPSIVGTLQVGPRSASSVPGPACYGLGGTEPTVTDADLMLGYLNPDRFLGGEMQLDMAACEAALARVGQKVGLSAAETAWGICSAVNENMAAAARVHIAEKGFDPRQFTLIATGGAGPVHAVDVARRLRISQVMCTIAAGAGSCLGLLAAPARADRSIALRASLADLPFERLAGELTKLKRAGEQELREAGMSPEAINWTLGMEMRYVGQSHSVAVDLPFALPTPQMVPEIQSAFERRYIHMFGGLVPHARIEVTTWRMVGRSPSAARNFHWADDRGHRAVAPGKRQIYLPQRRAFGQADVYDRYSLPAGSILSGPLVLEERESTIVVAQAARVEVLQNLSISITLEMEHADA